MRQQKTIITHRFTSPLRYPGGKGALAPYIKKVIEVNGLLDATYAEPFAGGAGIAWTLLFGEYVTNVLINDLSRPVYAFWCSVFDSTDELCGLISDTPVTIDQWRNQRTVQRQLEQHTDLELGFSTFFLNRTNRSGILKGGVIGGKEQTGNWKLDARFNKDDLIARIHRIARYKNRVRVSNLDAEIFLRTRVFASGTRILTYLDPPYVTKGGDLYENHYLTEDHRRLSELLRRRPDNSWLVSYDAVPLITDLYEGFKSVNLTVNYSAQSRRGGSEVMYYSPALQVPTLGRNLKLGRVLVQSGS